MRPSVSVGEIGCSVGVAVTNRKCVSLGWGVLWGRDQVCDAVDLRFGVVPGSEPAPDLECWLACLRGM